MTKTVENGRLSHR